MSLRGIATILCLSVLPGCLLLSDRDKQQHLVSEVLGLSYPYSVEWGSPSLDGGYQTSGVFQGAGEHEYVSFNYDSSPYCESYRLSIETRRFAKRRREIAPTSEEARAFVELVRLQVEKSVPGEVADGFISHTGDFRKFPGLKDLDSDEIKLLLLLKWTHWSVVRATEGA